MKVKTLEELVMKARLKGSVFLFSADMMVPRDAKARY